ncbi:hypothetical protein LINPERPRIM_LOCUS22588 [Linum perenne]
MQALLPSQVRLPNH